MLSQMLINVNKAKTTSSEREGMYIVEITWNDGIDADVDLWVKAPNNERSGFFSRDISTMSLLRDDLGNRNDYIKDETGKEVVNPINREEVTIRTPLPGKYIANIHYFRSPSDGKAELSVKAKLKKIKDGSVILEREMKLNSQGQELTLFTFTLNSQREIEETELPERPILWVVNSSGMVVP